MFIPNRRRLHRLKMLRLLDEAETAIGPATSLYVPLGLPIPEVEEMLRVVPNLKEIPPNLTELVSDSKTGAVLFWGQQLKYLVLPPFPLAERQASDGYEVEPLRSLLRRESMIALTLVRLGDYALGVFQGEKRVSSKVGTGLVHSRHKKGGSSQRRFERHREKQIEYLFDRVCTHVREHLEPHIRQLEYVIYGGEWNTLAAFRKQCRFLQLFEDRTLGSVLNIRKPRQATLEAAIGEAWSSELIEWTES